MASRPQVDPRLAALVVGLVRGQRDGTPERDVLVAQAESVLTYVRCCGSLGRTVLAVVVAACQYYVAVLECACGEVLVCPTPARVAASPHSCGC